MKLFLILRSLQLQCCGEMNYTSWANTKYFKEEGIPKSCCNVTAGVNCTTSALKDLKMAESVVYQHVRALLLLNTLCCISNIYSCKINVCLFLQGCFSLMTTTMEANLGIIAGISFGIAFFQVLPSFYFLLHNSLFNLFFCLNLTPSFSLAYWDIPGMLSVSLHHQQPI